MSNLNPRTQIFGEITYNSVAKIQLKQIYTDGEINTSENDTKNITENQNTRWSGR